MVNKLRRKKQTKSRTSYLVGGIVVIVLLATGTWYVFYSKGTTSTGTTTTTSIGTSAVKLEYARIDTNMGSFEVELNATGTPQTVANFVKLAQSGFYNNLVWHRIEPRFVIQTGDPNTVNGGGDRTTWGQGSSGAQIPFEYDPALHNYAGYLGMASTGAGVGGTSQFYINLADNSAALDGKYAVFGRVISSMGVVQAIGSVPVEQVGGQNEPVTPVYVTSITILSGP